MLSTHTIAGKLLQIDESLLSVAIVDLRGRTLSRKSRYHIKNEYAFGKGRQTVTYGLEPHSQWLSNVPKVLVVPLLPINSIVVLTMLPSVSVEYIIRKINLTMNYIVAGRSHEEKHIESDSKYIRK